MKGPNPRLLLFPVLLAFASSGASADVINVEFKFTPFVGNPASDEYVQTVPGTAAIFLNNIPLTTREVEEQELPVMYEAREVAAVIWFPVESLGPFVRKGLNTIRIEFDPADPNLSYQAHFRWALVTDQVSEADSSGHYSATNMGDRGLDDREAVGGIVFEREFDADFAADQPWHHYPPVTELSDDDRARLMALVTDRVDAFRPDFSELYEILDKDEYIDGDQARELKCLEAAYDVGVRMAAATLEWIEFITTDCAAVVIQTKNGTLFYPEDHDAFDKITDEDLRWGAQVAIYRALPARLIVARDPSGDWEIVF